MQRKILTLIAAALSIANAAAQRSSQGMLLRIDPAGGPAPCPLKHTDVKAEISGFLSRVSVTQEFENPLQQKIEAVYVFPLPHNAAVDDMTMLIGDRTVKGKIKRREEAQAIYKTARDAGYSAALLDQERPNIFTQAVANIKPGEKVKITIRYIETLKYEDGAYEFVFPMVVAPRYIPRGVSDRSRITPPLTPPGTRAGHDISVDITLDAGVPINFLRSLTHDIDMDRPTPHSATIHLKNKTEIPNKDFILQYNTSGKRVEDAVLAHRDQRGGFFTVILQPPDQTSVRNITPKELVFVLDTSGSMSGFPIEKAKEVMKLAIDGLNPRDTFNLITFSGDTHILFPAPVPATPENLRQAQSFLASRSGSGGTEMMKAIRAALAPSDAQDHIRVVCFMTDGEVGNDEQIIAEVKNHANARVFAFGIGSSTNRYLLDKMAEYGRGEVEYVGLEDDGSAAAKRFYQRVQSPLLTDITVDWAGLPVSDVYPKRIPDLFSAKPVILSGRYSSASKGVIRLHGKMAGKDFTREIAVTLPQAESRHDVLAPLWARRRIDNLTDAEAITQVALEYNLMTQYTSFVAVEDSIVTEGGRPRRVEVPVELPHGMSYEGLYGRGDIAYEKRGVQMQIGVMGGVSIGMSRPARLMPAEASEPTPVIFDRLNEMQQPSRKVDSSLLKQNAAKVRVKIWVTNTSKETIAQFKSLGVEVTILQPGKLITATVDSAKLLELAKLGVVQYIAPLN